MNEKLYYNITEIIVEEIYSETKNKLGVCACEDCTADVIAYALNQLPPRYVVTKIDAATMKLKAASFQNDADVKAAIYKGADLACQHPRHEV